MEEFLRAKNENELTLTKVGALEAKSAMEGGNGVPLTAWLRENITGPARKVLLTGLGVAALSAAELLAQPAEARIGGDEKATTISIEGKERPKITAKIMEWRNFKAPGPETKGTARGTAVQDLFASREYKGHYISVQNEEVFDEILTAELADKEVRDILKLGDGQEPDAKQLLRFAALVVARNNAYSKESSKLQGLLQRMELHPLDRQKVLDRIYADEASLAADSLPAERIIKERREIVCRHAADLVQHIFEWGKRNFAEKVGETAVRYLAGETPDASIPIEDDTLRHALVALYALQKTEREIELGIMPVEITPAVSESESVEWVKKWDAGAGYEGEAQPLMGASTLRQLMGLGFREDSVRLSLDALIEQCVSVDRVGTLSAQWAVLERVTRDNNIQEAALMIPYYQRVLDTMQELYPENTERLGVVDFRRLMRQFADQIIVAGGEDRAGLIKKELLECGRLLDASGVDGDVVSRFYKDIDETLKIARTVRVELEAQAHK